MTELSKAVCYIDNGPDALAYCVRAKQVIERCNMIPITYANFGERVRRSNQDREVRDDFYGAKVVAIRLSGDPGKVADHWAIAEFEKVWDQAFFKTRGERLLVYADMPIPVAILRQHRLPESIHVVRDLNHFETQFEIDLKALLA
jgi:hypothetical protein